MHALQKPLSVLDARNDLIVFMQYQFFASVRLTVVIDKDSGERTSYGGV